MTDVPLGRGAYKRLYAGSPEIELKNRWVEANPANPVEGTAVLARPGTTPLATLNPGGYPDLGSMRGNYTLSGLFDDSLFVVCGDRLYRISEDMTITPITGTISGTGYPEVTWQKGPGYERLWIADGQLLQFYAGPTSASGTITRTGSIVNGVDQFEIAGVHYTWGTTFNPSDAGTLANPFVVAPLADPMGQLVKAIMAAGVPGTDYSNTITAPNIFVRATSSSTTEATLTALLPGSGGNSLTFTVVGGTALSLTGTGTLLNGGLHVLQGCAVPDGQAPISITQVSSYILVAVKDSQTFYWINPGEITIDPLDFASKESNPDNISQLRTVGDQVVIIGEKSTENWYATGNLSAPFRPIEGRVYARGAISGTAVPIDDAVILVGDDGRVYSVGFSGGPDAGFGVQRISNNGIEERVRRQLRREAGLNP